jgi:hypothetical protein
MPAQLPRRASLLIYYQACLEIQVFILILGLTQSTLQDKDTPLWAKTVIVGAVYIKPEHRQKAEDTWKGWFGGLEENDE